jgi:hypothetical protein
MKKEKLIDDRNRKLYDRVREQYRVNLKKSDDHTWGSNIEGDKVIVYFSQTKHPISAFTHELLHSDTQLNGYKRIRGGVSLNKETHKHLGRICTCLDNELQHHKMFNKFLKLGFPPNEFYNDLDTETVPCLEKLIKKTGESFIILSVDYLTLLAPGGVIPADKFEELKQAFYDYDNGIYCDKFKVIDKIIDNWNADSSYDAEKHIIRFFKNLDAGQTWITYSNQLDRDLSVDNFPSTGFFTDNRFTIEELAEVLGQ